MFELAFVTFFVNHLRKMARSRYSPAFVPYGSPVLAGLRLVPLTDRPSHLPDFYSYDGHHPRHRFRPPGGITYVLLHDPYAVEESPVAILLRELRLAAPSPTGLYIHSLSL